MANKNVFVFLVLTWLMAYAAATWNYDLNNNYKPGYNLPARLEASEGQFTECWNALLKLNSCSNVTVKYFLNGRADISSDCCRAIEIGTRECSPSMLTSLGFTTEEGNVLKAYCSAYSAPVPASSSSDMPLSGFHISLLGFLLVL